MSRKITSGANSVAMRDRGAAVVGDPGDVAEARHRQLEHLRGIHIVFDDQHAQVACLPPPAAVRRRRLPRPAPRVIGKRISTSVPWPRPGLRMSIRPSCISTSRRASVSPMPSPPLDRSRIGLGLLEHVEDAGQDVRSDADAGIADAHDGLTGLLVRGEPDVAAARRELHRVVEDVRKDLHEPRRHHHRRESASTARCTSSVLLRRGRQRHDGFDRRRHQPREVVRFTTQLNLVGRDPRHIQEVVDEPHELPDLAIDHVTGACRRRRRGAALQALECEPDGCERIAELVGERGQKLVLSLIRFDQFGGPVADPGSSSRFRASAWFLAVWRLSMRS